MHRNAAFQMNQYKSLMGQQHNIIVNNNLFNVSYNNLKDLYMKSVRPLLYKQAP